MLRLEVNIKKTGGFDAIRKFMQGSEPEIYIGFLSGKQHVQTLHKKGNGKKAEYRGIDGGAPELNSMDNSELARILTFGNARIPPRPFIEDGIREHGAEIKKTIGEQLSNVKNGRPAVWDKVGTQAVGAVQEFVRGDWYKSHVPNSPRTQKYKDGDTPLIDGGELINSLEYVIKKG